MVTKQLSLISQIDDICAGNGVDYRPPRYARDIMTKEVRTLTLDHTVSACIRLMKALGVRHIPLMDAPLEGDKKPYFVGIVSDRDVLRMNLTFVDQPGGQRTDRRALRQLLAQIVERKTRTVSPRTTISEVITIMLKNHFDMVPVIVDEEIVGIVTSMDIIRVFLKITKTLHQLCPDIDDSLPPSGANPLNKWISRTVRDVMTEHVITLSPQDELFRAIDIMQENEFRHIPITDEQGGLKGIISDRDVLRHLHYAGRRPLWPQKKFRDHLFRADPDFVNLWMPLETVMTTKVNHVPPETDTYTAAKKLRKSKISCLPVVDGQNDLMGIVTVTDLMSTLLTLYE